MYVYIPFSFQNALRSFMEVSAYFPEELRSAANFSHVLEATDESGRTLAQREFIEVSLCSLPDVVYNLRRQRFLGYIWPTYIYILFSSDPFAASIISSRHFYDVYMHYDTISSSFMLYEIKWICHWELFVIYIVF